jgi:hypothetical protein
MKAKKEIIYKDKNITLYSNKWLDEWNITDFVNSTIDAALIGAKTHSEMAKYPMELYKLYIEQIYNSVEVMRKIIEWKTPTD